MIDFNKVYNADCLKILKELPNESIKTTITSPPYNLGGDFHTFVDGKRVTYGDYQGYKDKIPEDKYQEWQRDILYEIHRVTKENGWCFYNHKNRIVNGSIISPLEWISKTNWNLCQVVVIDFRATPNVDKRRFFPVHELLYVLSKNNKQKLNNFECFTDVWQIKRASRKQTGHPATFDIELPLRCIKASSEEGDVVADWFCGVGTTLKASKMLNRKFIGTEISPEYYEKSLINVSNVN